jgi:arylsulfatase A-like enzyme
MRNGMSKAFLTGLSAAFCAGCLDLALSLWLDPPAGLRSAANLLLTLAASTAIALLAWLATYSILRLLLRSRPQPLALPISASLLTAVLLRGVLVAIAPAEAPLGRAALPIAIIVIAVGLLVHKLERKGGGAPLPGEGGAMGEGSGVRSLRVASGALLALVIPSLLLLDRSTAATPPTARPLAVPRVILLSIDTLRADSVACSGAPEVRAPHLDALAGESLCFSQALSPSAWTLPAMASVMTGVSPQVHGALHLRSRVPEGLPTLAEVLRRSGYRTAAFVSSTVLGPQSNLAQGFDEFHAWPGPWLGRSLGASLLTARVPRFRPDEAPPPALADAVTGWLGKHRDEPFFLWVHAFDPHAPYGPPRRHLRGRTPPPGGRWRFEGWDEEAIRAGTWVPTAAERDWIRQLYLAEVRWVDETVGRLLADLKRLGLYDDALIVVLADHGEEFWEHGAYGHGHTLYDELLHVPLLTKLPRSERTGRLTTPVSTASVFSTVLDACKLRLPTGHPAASSLLAVPTEGPTSPILSLGLNRFEDRSAVRFGRFKYIRWMTSGKEELYDLERDRGEAVNLAETSPSEVAEARRLLASFEAEARQARQLLRLPDGETAEIDDKTLERLRSLGYAR